MPTTLVELLKKIDDAVEDDNFELALHIIEASWDHLPDAAPLRERTAMVLASMGKKREAVEIYRLVARHYANAGYPTRALAAIKQMQALKPGSNQLLDHFTTLYSVRSPFLDRQLQQSDLPEPTGEIEFDGEASQQEEQLFDLVVERAKTPEGTAEKPDALPPLPLLSLLPPKALRRLLDFLSYEIYAETQPIVGPDLPTEDLFWAVGSDLVVTEGNETFRIPAGALLGLRDLGGTVGDPSPAVLSQKGSECLRLSRDGIDSLADEFPDFPNRLSTLHRHALTEGLFESHPLFAVLDDGARADLPEQLMGLKLESATTMIRQDEMSPGLYVLLDGSVRLVRDDDRGQTEIARIAPGEVLGEIGLLDPRPAITSAITAEPSHLLFFPREDFVCFADDHPAVAELSKERVDEQISQLQQILQQQ